MAFTTTYVNAALGASGTQLTVAAYTNPVTSTPGAQAIGVFATGEQVLIQDATNSPTLAIVRGYNGTTAAAHSLYEGFRYGLTSDSQAPGYVQYPQIGNKVEINAQEVTATGTTGTTAAVVTQASTVFLNCTGASGAGVNLFIPNVGDTAIVKNLMTGALKVYCVGGTINGTTGTTAITVTATGTLGMLMSCATSGAWQVAIAAT